LGLQLFIAALGDQAREKAFEWLSLLGADGISVEMDYAGRSLKAQMKRADRHNAGHVLIVGETELDKGAAVLRNMTTKEQQDVPLEGVVAHLTKTLG
jgi:histidyl-tRNA synthetase